jgi:hypothetical protein
MTGVLRARVSGAWVDVLTPGPPGPTGATGPTGPTGPAGPTQQAVRSGANAAIISVPAATWAEYGIATLSLPYAGQWLVRVWGMLGCAGGDMQLSIGLGHTNHWRSTIPWTQTPAAAVYQLMMEEPFTLAAGSVDVSAFVWVSGGGGSFRYGNAVLTYFGP